MNEETDRSLTTRDSVLDQVPLFVVEFVFISLQIFINFLLKGKPTVTKQVDQIKERTRLIVAN